MPTYATVVRIKHQHNHIMLNSADALTLREVGEETVEKFRELFATEHSPSSALDVHKLQPEHGDASTYEAVDRAKCPDLSFSDQR